MTPNVQNVKVGRRIFFLYLKFKKKLQKEMSKINTKIKNVKTDIT